MESRSGLQPASILSVRVPLTKAIKVISLKSEELKAILLAVTTALACILTIRTKQHEFTICMTTLWVIYMICFDTSGLLVLHGGQG
ncbi:hypothetical protein P8452_31944 [Trifolium repens]|nr:hypothetical protein P8452_31944 [Trifolium repens]